MDNEVVKNVNVEVKNAPIKLQKGKTSKERNLEAVCHEDDVYGPMLTLSNGVDKEWSFGVVKARNIVAAFDAIKEFATLYKDHVATSRKNKKLDEIELTEEEKDIQIKLLTKQLMDRK